MNTRAKIDYRSYKLSAKTPRWRFMLICVLLSLLLLSLVGRLVDLSLLDRHFLLSQSNARTNRIVSIPAHRGMITDRTNSVLAISTPVYSVWVNPQIFQATDSQLLALSHLLDLSKQKVMHRTRKSSGRGFVYLKRRNPPDVMQAIKALKIPGVFFQKEYKRYYPEGEVSAHVVGLTNVDDVGQEGLELAYDRWLKGVPGKQEVQKDRLGHVIADLAVLKKPKEGSPLVLSIDHRVQYLAYRALKKQVTALHAASGSIVALDIKTGEVLAMVNQPSYNPNNRPSDRFGRYRNRAVTDTFEPGSTMKPFTIALALDSDRYTPKTIVDTNPGRMKVGGYVIRDDGLNHGKIDLQQILQKSSNIGAAKILLSLSPEHFWHLLRSLGFGQRTDSSFPGESPGRLVSHTVWYPSDVATLAYGYGISVTTLQLAKAYAILASGGMARPVSLLKVNKIPHAKRVLSQKVCEEIDDMLASVVKRGGTGTRAQVPGFTVAGKTGTAYIANANGYDKKRYMASFVGFAPVADPKFVVAVVIRDPKKRHFGGLAAAPVFSTVMGGLLRIFDVAPAQS